MSYMCKERDLCLLGSIAEVHYLTDEVWGRLCLLLLLRQRIIYICVFNMLVEPQTRGLDIISIVCESSNCSISGETHIHNHANIALTVTQRFASFLQEFPSLFVVLGNELLNVQDIIHMNEGVELFC